jgi:large subunit ribosomal protein L31
MVAVAGPLPKARASAEAVIPNRRSPIIRRYPLSSMSPFGQWRLTTQMKADIHPKYMETTVTCGCGNTFQTRSIRKELKVDICNECHPFFTGKLKYVDTAGRIEKFQNKFAAGTYASLATKKKAPAKKK